MLAIVKEAVKKVTVNLPAALLERARSITQRGVTETIVQALLELDRQRQRTALQRGHGCLVAAAKPRARGRPPIRSLRAELSEERGAGDPNSARAISRGPLRASVSGEAGRLLVAVSGPQ